MLFFVANTNAAYSGFFGEREAVAAKGGSSTIYRAVSQVEAADIAKFGLGCSWVGMKLVNYLPRHLRKQLNLVSIILD